MKVLLKEGNERELDWLVAKSPGRGDWLVKLRFAACEPLK